MAQKRRQLTLFVDQEEDSKIIESARKQFNPVQFELIKAHVTLCREDEIEQLDRVLENLKNLDFESVLIDFGRPIRFLDGHGVLLPADDGQVLFQKLRKKILLGLITNPRKHEPHLTLMHPRNSICTDEIFKKIEKMDFPKKIEFKKIYLIEQELDKKWEILEKFELKTKI